MWKKCKIIMLPTKDKTNILSFINKDDSLLLFFYRKSIKIPNERYNHQHLYIISDDEIKEGDWCLIQYDGESKILQCSKANHIGRNSKIVNHLFNNNNYEYSTKYCNKIIASTDRDLLLPFIPEGFISYYIEEYNKKHVITDILVGYRRIKRPSGEYFYPQVSKYNYIPIKGIKECWTKEEVMTLFYNFRRDHIPFGTVDDELMNDWLEVNLMI